MQERPYRNALMYRTTVSQADLPDTPSSTCVRGALTGVEPCLASAGFAIHDGPDCIWRGDSSRP